MTVTRPDWKTSSPESYADDNQLVAVTRGTLRMLAGFGYHLRAADWRQARQEATMALVEAEAAIVVEDAGIVFENESAAVELRNIAAEFARADAKFPPFNSSHEGFAVLKEEVDELWHEVKANDKQRQREEAVQVGAMALRFLVDLEGKHGK